MKSESKTCSVMSNFLWPHGLYTPWNSLGQNTKVGSLSLLQGIFPTSGSNPCLLHCRWILYQLSHKGRKPKNTGVGSPFHPSNGSSWPRNQTGVSCIAGGFFTKWSSREVRIMNVCILIKTFIFYPHGTLGSHNYWISNRSFHHPLAH